VNDERATTTGPDWPSLHGNVLEGGYEIQELLGADLSRRTFKIRILGGASAHAFVNIYPVGGAPADEQVALWRRAAQLQHSNLNLPLAAGRIHADGVDLIYVVLPRADEVLEDILRERPLSPREAGEVLLSASRALEYLRANGFVHGCVSPEQVLASGDTVKLAGDCIRKVGSAPAQGLFSAKYTAPESDGRNATPEADVWCLGATLLEALTQDPCQEDCRERAAQLPGAFGTLAPLCLDPDPQARCKLVDLPPPYGRKPTPPPPEPLSPALPPTPVFETAQPRTPVTVLSHGVTQNPKLWIYAAIGVFVLCIVIWLARPKHRPQPAVPVVQSAAPAKPANAWPTRTIPPETAAAAKPHPAPARSEPASGNGAVWRVVVYTYSRPADAQKMARSLNEKHAGLNAEVFTPEGDAKAYLVVVGGRMARDQAARLRRQVRSMGLPRDSYIQNYKQ